MKSLEKLKTVLSDVEINEEQKAALDEFFAELYENLQEKAREEVQDELDLLNEEIDTKGGSREGWIRVEEAEAAFNRGMMDAERAFNSLSEEYDLAMEKNKFQIAEMLKDKNFCQMCMVKMPLEKVEKNKTNIIFFYSIHLLVEPLILGVSAACKFF